MRPTRAIIHLENLKHNIRSVQAWTAAHSPGPATARPKLCIAVKADAYGHGIVETARAAVECGTEYLAVATVDEAVQVREAGISVPLLLYSLPGTSEIPVVVSQRLTPLVTDRAYVDALAEESRSQGVRTSCHIKVDTGMGRIGCRPEDTLDLARAILSHEALSLDGVSTHYPMADHSDDSYTREQTGRFASCVADLRDHDIDPGIVHASNSGGLLRVPEG
ncbi:MAG: alanine racemase, partial [bacterium]